MALELRPTWCLGDENVEAAIRLGTWLNGSGLPALMNDGDSWKPGEAFQLDRSLELAMDTTDLRRHFNLRAGASVGVAARWTCRATGTAGVHRGGPAPLDLASTTVLSIDVPAEVAGSIELETCLVVSRSEGERPAGSCPPGALIWSDGWSTMTRDRTILLEGSEARIPVRTMPFNQRFGAPSGALWSIDLDPAAEMTDNSSNFGEKLKSMLAEMDGMQPTIAPVIDLSNVKMGVDAIGSMMDGTSIDAGVSLIEQPVARWNVAALKSLSEQLPGAMLMADESVCTPFEAMALAGERACHVFSLKVAKHGGLVRTRKVAAIAEAADIGWYGGTMLETSLGSAASAHVFATLGSQHHGCELFGPQLLVDDIVERQMPIVDFELQLPDGPGFGVDISLTQLNRFDRARRAQRLLTPQAAPEAGRPAARVHFTRTGLRIRSQAANMEDIGIWQKSQASTKAAD